MQNAALVLLLVAAGITAAGLVPCLGWLNWFAVPISCTTVLIGGLGLANDKDPTTGLPQAQALYLTAVLVGGLLIGLGVVRCTLGGGLV